MKKNEAIEMAAKFREIGGFSLVQVKHFGFDIPVNSDKWEVQLISINPTSGNRNCKSVIQYDPANAPAIAAETQGKVKARDKAALHRIAVEREINRE